ncbi:hypothetical protein HYU15_00570 [Candidatus Woesearchaeota archaeon]|nr:hypothetical protein [Candidatus Woesearchaeota archaeon]
MSLDVIARILTRHGAVATANHDLPPFCAVYDLHRDGSMLNLTAALALAHYRLTHWRTPEEVREMLAESPSSQASGLIVASSRLIVPAELERYYVMRQAAAFLRWLITPQSYGLIVPVISP